MAKLRAELKPTSATASWSQLEQLPYLSAIIEEANRLSFGVTARLCRKAPEPLTYVSPPTSLTAAKSYTIPPGIPVSIATPFVHLDESIFLDPYAFDPERWLGQEGAERRKYQMAFNKGGRKCLGIELARAEMYLATAAIARRFDMTLFETDVDDVAFLHDYHVALPRLDSKGVRAIVKSKSVRE